MIILLGMHRSGTSAMAGMLHSAGICLGDKFMSPLPENPKGFFEDLKLQHVNKQILNSIGRNWDDIPTDADLNNVPESIYQSLPATYRYFESRFQKWAWKDPRLCLTFPLWAKILPIENLNALFILRHPMSVARSLHHRNQMPLEKGMELWLGYNQKIIKILKHYQLPYTFIRYESLISKPEVHQKVLERRLKIQMGSAWGFIDNKLNRSETEDSSLPEHIKRTYEKIIQEWDNTESTLKSLEDSDLIAGEISFKKGRIGHAKSCFEKVLKKYPNHPEAFNNLGVIAFFKGNHDEAVSLFNKSLEVNENDFYAIFNKANCLKTKGDFLGAINEYGKALNMDTENVDILNALQKCCRLKVNAIEKTNDKGSDTFKAGKGQTRDKSLNRDREPALKKNNDKKNGSNRETDNHKLHHIKVFDSVPRIQIVSFSDIEKDAARKLRWGDHWVKLEIQKAFEKRGYIVTDSNPDVILHLFGVPVQGLPVGPYKIAWIHSHPDLLTPRILSRYDKIYCLSPLFLNEIRKWGFQADLLIGGTSKSFVKKKVNANIVFVGNIKNRPLGRKIISDLKKTTHMNRLMVWGEGWESIIPEENYGGIYYENGLLNDLYASSYIVLNDHHDDMRRKGFLNPRILDVFASGGFVISDDVKGLDDIFHDSLVTYRNHTDLDKLIRYYFSHPLERDRMVRKGGEIVHEFSFDNMVDTFIKKMELVFQKAV